MFRKNGWRHKFVAKKRSAIGTFFDNHYIIEHKKWGPNPGPISCVQCLVCKRIISKADIVNSVKIGSTVLI